MKRGNGSFEAGDMDGAGWFVWERAYKEEVKSTLKID